MKSSVKILFSVLSMASILPGCGDGPHFPMLAATNPQTGTPQSTGSTPATTVVPVGSPSPSPSTQPSSSPSTSPSPIPSPSPSSSPMAYTLSGYPSYYLRLDSDNLHLDIWNSNSASGPFTDQILVSNISSLTATTSGGAGTFTIDNSSGLQVSPSALINLIGDGSTTLKIIGSGAGDSIVLNSQSLIFNNWLAVNFSGVSEYLLDPVGGTDDLSINALKLVVAAPAPGSGVTLRKFSSISIASGAELQFLSPTNHSDRALVQVPDLLIAGALNNWSGTLDIGGNDLDITDGDLSTIENQIASGYNAANKGYWNGTGIQSSQAAEGIYQEGYGGVYGYYPIVALGVIQNNQCGNLFGSASNQSLFDGIAPGASDILVKYTYYGDAQLLGYVDGNDYSITDNGYLKGLSGWCNGDFNYDGVIDGSDYALIDTDFNIQGPAL